MTEVWAAIPVKGFADAKQRLAPVMGPEQRRDLARAMLEDVLQALAAAPLAGVMVNTEDREAAGVARRCGARVLAMDARSGHTAAVAAMARLLAREGAAAMLTLPGDVPRVTAAEITALCEAAPGSPCFVISPAHDRRGSNAVLVSPPDAVPLRFGNDSFYPHLEAARRCGLEPLVMQLPGIGLDIDQPADLEAFVCAVPVMDTRAFGVVRGFLRGVGEGVAYSPVKRGGRLSRKALTASR